MAWALVLNRLVCNFRFSRLILIILVLILHDRLFQQVEQEVEVRMHRKKKHSGIESAEWLNVVFNRWQDEGVELDRGRTGL